MIKTAKKQPQKLQSEKSVSSDENVLSLYLKEINKIPLLTMEEEDRYARLAAQGDKDAREKLLKANLRFVVNVAKKISESRASAVRPDQRREYWTDQCY